MTETGLWPEPEVAKLCVNCQWAVELHDGLGGYEESTGTDGLPCLTSPRLNAPLGYWLQRDSLPDLPRLAESSRLGCDFCGFLREAILSTDTRDAVQLELGNPLDDFVGQDIAITAHYLWGDHEHPQQKTLNRLRITIEFEGQFKQLFLHFVAEAAPRDEEVARWLRLAAPSKQRYDDEHCTNWMTQILDDCSQHGHQSISAGFLPERLIDVQGPVPRLVLRSDVINANANDVAPNFSALSYCWGSNIEASTQLKTTTVSLVQRQLAIHDHEMTEVLRDAIQITKTLSIPYLWVDALCVLQDDISDWEKQCVDMDKIYGNAYVTLCAASSVSCCEGFLRQRGSRIRMPFESELRPEITGSYFLQFKYASSHRVPFSELFEDATKCRWSNRGWVFQEKALSTRRLLFGNRGLHFICKELHATMGGPKINAPYDSTAIIFKGASVDQDDLYSQWEGLVADYSQLQRHSFTKITDLLPALSGLASAFHTQLQDRYVAGLWMRDLFRSLVWYRNDRALPQKSIYFADLASRPHAYLVPSWAPLAKGYVEGIRPTSHALFRSEADLLGAQIDLVGTNPFGAIRDGSLCIRSLVLNLSRLEIGKLTVMARRAGPKQVFTSWALVYDGVCVGKFWLDFSYTRYKRRDQENLEEEGSEIQVDLPTLEWVLLGSCVEGEGISDREEGSSRGVFGLILYPVPNCDKYVRVGAFLPEFTEGRSGGLGFFRGMGELKTVGII